MPKIVLVVIGTPAGLENYIANDEQFITDECSSEDSLTILREPTLEQLRDGLQNLMFGNALYPRHLYFLGHGEEGGYLMVRDNLNLHGSELTSLLSDAHIHVFNRQRVYVDIKCHLNCCYSDDITIAMVSNTANVDRATVISAMGCFKVSSESCGDDYGGITSTDVGSLVEGCTSAAVCQLRDLYHEAHERANNEFNHVELVMNRCAITSSKYYPKKVTSTSSLRNDEVEETCNVEVEELGIHESTISWPDDNGEEGSLVDQNDVPVSSLGAEETESASCSKMFKDMLDVFRKISSKNLNGNFCFNVNGDAFRVTMYIAGFGPVPAVGMLPLDIKPTDLIAMLNVTRSKFPPALDPKPTYSRTSPTLTLFSEGCGDATLVCLPFKNNWVHLLIDGGYSYKHWGPTVRALDKLDVLMVTHSDEDHIGGIDKLATVFEELKGNFIIKNVVMTAKPRENQDVQLLRSYNQWNRVHKAFASKLTGAAYAKRYHCWGDNIKLFIVSPSTGGYDAELDRLNESVNKKAEVTKVVDGLTCQNYASIVTLLMWRQSKNSTWISILFTADAPGASIIQGLKELAAEPGDEYIAVKNLTTTDDKFHVTYMDIPHHGSSINTKGFFEHVTANNYGYSYNGCKHETTMCNGKTLDWLIAAHGTISKNARVFGTFAKFSKEDAATSYACPNFTKEFGTEKGAVTLELLEKEYHAWEIEL